MSLVQEWGETEWKGKEDVNVEPEKERDSLKWYAQFFAGKEQGNFNLDVNLVATQDPSLEIIPEAQACVEVQPQIIMDERSPKKELMATFGYPVGKSKKPSYARFDIRDEVCRRVCGSKHGQVVRDSGNADKEYIVVGVKPDLDTGKELIWVQTLDCKERVAFPLHSDKSQLVAVLRENSEFIRKRVDLCEATPSAFEAAEDSDGEEMLLCGLCHLPIGTNVYADECGNPLHGECMAQKVLQENTEEEAQLRQKQAVEKKASRDKYAIGWNTECIPRNMKSASSLTSSPVMGDMCCLMLQDSSQGLTLSTTSTFNPAACLNLEYFSLALKVRSLEGREPMFSLDPLANTFQQKHFEPSWLKGTSVGEVLFQSDYHLKELAMGEYEQPVIGMKSCLDYSWEEGLNKQWHAREWFVVQKAEIQLSDDDVLIPCLQMGVEAREQVPTANGLEDKPITRANHPLVKYAEEFTNNFDLIAERKSSIYHLRELAKASVLAKFVLEAQMQLDAPWFNLAGEGRPDELMEIPQLWNEHRSSQIQVKDGKIEPTKKMHCLYGGVEFGLDKFAISGRVGAAPAGAARPGFQALKLSPAQLRGAIAARRPAVPAKAPAVSVSLANLRTTFGVISSMAAVAPEKEVAPPPGAPAAAVAAVSAPGAVPGMPRMMAPGVQMGPAPVKPTARMPTSLVKQLSTPGGFPHFTAQDQGLTLPRGTRVAGVDLNLDNFSLEEPVRVTSELSAGKMRSGNIACAFWSELDNDSESVFKSEDKHLLRAIFKQTLSDRREEGDRFIPPNPSPLYIEKLRTLVQQEETTQQQRKEHFFSSNFAAENPGPLFPLSWVSTHVITRGQQQGSQLQARPDYLAQPAMFDLKSATPSFDKTTEEGLRFRMYKIGSLEVRTTQEDTGKEIIGAVYSIRSSISSSTSQEKAQDHDKVVKVTEYVEVAQQNAVYCHSYTVLETVHGDVIVTEKLKDGTVTWEENPQDLEDRNSLAKCIRACDWSRGRNSVTVGDMKSYKDAHATESGASHSKRKHYAQLVFNRVKGMESRAQSGFANKDFWKKDKEATNFRKDKLRFNKETERATRRAAGRPKKVDMTVTSPVVVGSWTNWEIAQPMKFDEQNNVYTLDMKIDRAGSESFQILCNNDWERCIHPDKEDACTHEAHKLCGPDSEGHGKNWTIGLHKNDRVAKGVRYRIMLKVTRKGLAENVEWVRLGPGVLLA